MEKIESNYWFEEYLREFKLTRYALERDYGLRQSTTCNLLKNRTAFDNIKLSTAYALARAANMTIVELAEKYSDWYRKNKKESKEELT